MSEHAPALNGLQLAPEWIDWLVENYVEGVPSGDLLHSLKNAGVPDEIAEGAVKEVEQSTLLRSFLRKVVQRDQLEALLVLKRELARTKPLETIERKANVSADEFFTNYYSANRPVILTDVAHQWPALKLWSQPEYFAEKFGDLPITVCMGRESDQHCDRNFSKHFKETTMEQYARWVANAGESNDGYLISNNRLMENEGFHCILNDIIAPDKYVDAARFRTHMSFWFGPAGTRTPLHHDSNNILFCQVAGKKEFYLISPWETELTTRAQGYYAHTQVPAGMLSEGCRPADEQFPWSALRVVLQPGEAIFLPVGWWHQVRALEMSVSISFLNFRANNDFAWYAPGKLNK